MKRLFNVIAIGGLLASSIAGTAQGQMPGTTIRASIPFDFIVRGRTLPAGRYEIKRINDEPSGLLIQNADHKRDEAMFETEPIYVARAARKDVLVFHRYGDSYFLSEVVTASEQTGRELAPSREERQLRREMASNQAAPETVTVAINQ
jgi:hypothetical protein